MSRYKEPLKESKGAHSVPVSVKRSINKREEMYRANLSSFYNYSALAKQEFSYATRRFK